MSSDPNLQWTQWATTGGGILAVGAGLKWLWGQITARMDKRTAELDRREEELEEREEQRVRELSERVEGLESTVARQGEELHRLYAALNILVAKEERTDPGSVELRRVREILINGVAAVFPVPLAPPPSAPSET